LTGRDNTGNNKKEKKESLDLLYLAYCLDIAKHMYW